MKAIIRSPSAPHAAAEPFFVFFFKSLLFVVAMNEKPTMNHTMMTITQMLVSFKHTNLRTHI